MASFHRVSIATCLRMCAFDRTRRFISSSKRLLFTHSALLPRELSARFTTFDRHFAILSAAADQISVCRSGFGVNLINHVLRVTSCCSLTCESNANCDPQLLLCSCGGRWEETIPSPSHLTLLKALWSWRSVDDR